MEERNRNIYTLKRIYFITIIILLCTLLGQRFYSRKYVPVPKGQWDKLYLVLDQIEKNYVDPIEAATIVEKSLPFILAELDPHSIYLPPEELKQADNALEGSFDGIGITFNVPNDTVVVSSVISGGPSERAGVRPGDRIINVDETTIAGVKMAQDSIIRRLRGPRGSNVTIQVERFGASGLIPISIIRDKIEEKSVNVAYMIDKEIGYVKLSMFSKTSYEEVLKALGELMIQGMTKLVFDLRYNSGGYMEPALRIANEFLEKGQLIMYQEGERRIRQDYFAKTHGLASLVELVVLINESSASSSEILAGALQDNDRATIVGRRSFGKGLVQEPIYFSDYSGIRLTVARYYTPTGRCLQRPYDGGLDSYRYDLWERYRHGELTHADSIPKNDSLKYVTPKGKVVYGGGGIIPDIFVSIDTTSLGAFYAGVNQKNLQIRFAFQFADRHREELEQIEEMDKLERFWNRFDFSSLFLKYAADHGVVPQKREWEDSKYYILTQLKAYVGRVTSMEDKAFYPIIGILDRELTEAIQVLR